MLLSIDRVLKLLSEGKTLEKIADMASCDAKDVQEIIEEARQLLNKHEKPLSKKKIIIKKDTRDDPVNSDNAYGIDTAEILEGAELSTIPLDSSLTIYIDGASRGNPGPSGIGIVIFDSDQRQIGKVSAYIGTRTNNIAEYSALIRALKIALYFKTKSLKIRTDSELIVKQINGEYAVKNEKLKTIHREATELIDKFKNFKIEHVTRNLNEKADYLAKQGSMK